MGQFLFETDHAGVNVATREDLLERVHTRLTQREGFALATLNLDHLVKLRHDAHFRAAYGAQDMVVADGNPIVWLGRLAGRQFELVPGSDIVEPLLQVAAQTRTPVAFFGATQEALDAAAEVLAARVPGLEIVGRIAPPMGFDPAGAAADRAIEALRDTGAGLCLVALGAPKQEIFAAHARQQLAGVGFASIGASLDFYAGTQVRAPVWVRRIAMEWLWRMMGNPRRLVRRYAACAAILPGEALAALAQRRRPGSDRC